MKIRLSRYAHQDLGSIYRYSADQWGRQQADRYISALWDRLEALIHEPESHRLRNDIYSGCRIAYEGKHAIIYRIKEGRVEIARVLHAAMDLRQHIPGAFLRNGSG